MPQIIAVDGGNFETKVITSHGYDCFNSSIGERRDLKATESFSRQDMDFHIINKYDDIKGFAGELASLESEYGGTIFGTSKNHTDARVRILLGVYRNLRDYTVNLVVGQPYETHTPEEKNDIIESLKGKHIITVNGKTKEFQIENVLVGVEGGMAFWSNPYDGPINIIDVGSGTVNCIHFFNKRIIDMKCNTLPFGSETSKGKVNFEGMAKAIFNNMNHRWDKDHLTLICGGSANEIYIPLSSYYSNIKIMQPRVILNDISMPLDVKFANAAGMYEAGVKAYARVQVS